MITKETTIDLPEEDVIEVSVLSLRQVMIKKIQATD